LVLVPAIIGAYLFLPTDVFLMILSSFASFIFLPFSILIIYTQVQKEAKVIAIAGSIASILSLAIKLVLVYLKLPLIYFTAMAGFDVVAGAAVLLFYYIQKPEWRSVIFSNYNVKFFSIFPFIYKMRYGVVFSIAWQMLLRIDQLLLPALKGAYSLGIYSAAVKISEVPNVLAGVVYMTLLSRVVPLIESKTEIAKEKVRKIFWIYFLLGVLASAFMIIFAPMIISILYGAKFLESIPVLRIYALSIPFMFLCFYYHTILGALDKKRLMALVYVICAILNVLLVIILTKYFDLYGTASATVMTYGLAVLSFYFYLKNENKNTK
jgi:O-antigen/teichoic acid export membrane protein